MAEEDPANEVERIRSVYGDYDGDKWSLANVGNELIRRERDESILGAVRAQGAISSLLDLGCGYGSLLGEINRLHLAETPVGAELLLDRCVAVAARSLHVANIDGASLPFRDSAFDVIIMMTVLSSVSRNGADATLMREVDRCLSNQGTIVMYDMRVPSPNKNVCRVTKRYLKSQLPGFAIKSRSLTLAPPVSRRLTASTSGLYGPLANLGILNTHSLHLARRRGD